MHILLYTLFSICTQCIHHIHYRFLTWATPSNEVAPHLRPNFNLTSSGPDGSTGHTPGSILTFLESHLSRQVDLMSIFARYDKSGSGRVTADDFSNALSDLGLSTVSRKDIQELGYRLKCSIGDYILYRRLLTQVYQELDITTKATDIDIVDLLKSTLARSHVETKQLINNFEKYDQKFNGYIPVDDLKFVFDDIGVKIKRSEVDSIIEKYSNSIDVTNRFPYKQLLTDLTNRGN